MSKRASTARPEPVPVNVVCSLCGEVWHLHAAVDGEVSTLECIRLLKAKATRIPYSVPLPMPVYPRPWYQQPYVHWTYTQTAQTATSIQPNTGSYTINCSSEQRTPTVALASAAA